MIVSSIEGRIRFLDENIKRPEIADKINTSLKSLDGIDNIRINQTIGSLLVNYSKEETLIELINILNEYIDTRENPKDYPKNNSNYVNKVVDVFRKGIENQKYKRGKNNPGSNKSNLLNLGVENLTGNGLIKFALYSVLGVKGYKKGKGFINSQGKGRKI